MTTADTRAALQPTANSAVDTTQTITEELRHTVTTADTRAALQPTASSAVDTTQTLTEELTDTQ